MSPVRRWQAARDCCQSDRSYQAGSAYKHWRCSRLGTSPVNTAHTCPCSRPVRGCRGHTVSVASIQRGKRNREGSAHTRRSRARLCDCCIYLRGMRAALSSPRDRRSHAGTNCKQCCHAPPGTCHPGMRCMRLALRQEHMNRRRRAVARRFVCRSNAQSDNVCIRPSCSDLLLLYTFLECMAAAPQLHEGRRSPACTGGSQWRARPPGMCPARTSDMQAGSQMRRMCLDCTVSARCCPYHMRARLGTVCTLPR